MGKVIEGLAKFVVETRFEDLPAPVVHEAKNLLMDAVGDGLAGITTDPGKMAITLAKSLGGPPESSIIGTSDKVSCANAVLANGQLINTLDFDTVMPGGHAPGYIVPPALAMAERARTSGKELLLATALGFEVAARIARATPPGMFFDAEKQFHFAPREGYAKTNVGAAAAAARLLKLSHDQMMNALASAGHMSQVLTWTRGNYCPSRDMLKYGMPGWQNTGAVMAALLAQMGFMGDVEVFDDVEHGFGEVCGYSGWNPDKILPGLGETWDFIKVPYKKYACCTMLHAPLEVFYGILKKNNLKPEEIESVTVQTNPTVESKLFTSRQLRNIVDVQFGMHYVLSLAAYGYQTGIEWQDWDIVTQPKIGELAKKVSFKAHPEYGSKPITSVEVKARGQTFKDQMVGGLPKLSDEQLVEKYRHNASRSLTLNKIEGSVKAFLGLENLAQASELIAQITL
jgi:2-methylcitrate dehydratase PrpD